MENPITLTLAWIPVRNKIKEKYPDESWLVDALEALIYDEGVKSRVTVNAYSVNIEFEAADLQDMVNILKEMEFV